MTEDHRLRQQVSSMAAFLALARTRIKRAFRVSALLFLSLGCFAQDQPVTTPQPNLHEQQATSPSEKAMVTVPAGTKIALVLTNPISSKTVHRGDTIYAQITAPVPVGSEVVIPAGTFVQSKVDKLSRNGSRAEMLMQSAAVVFPDGYVVNIAEPITVESDEGTAWLNPGGGAKVGAIAAPMAGLGLGALIGNAAHTTQSSSLGGMTITSSTPKGLAIGSIVGLAAGAAVALVLLSHSRQFFVDVGSPMEMTLPQPLTLAENQVAEAIRQVQAQPPVVVPVIPRPQPPALTPTNTGTCYTPDTPGTPPIVIPGTPPIGNTPGTPDVVIPGTPAIAGTPYPCP